MGGDLGLARDFLVGRWALQNMVWFALGLWHASIRVPVQVRRRHIPKWFA